MKQIMIICQAAFMLSACDIESEDVEAELEDDDIGAVQHALTWPPGDNNTDDTIFFGYCDSCHAGGPGLRICEKIGDTTTTVETMALSTERLYIRGRGGNDYIQAINDNERGECTFGIFSNLTYERVYLIGGEGNDSLIGTEGTQRIYGQAGDDYIQGYSGDDILNGGDGEDFLQGDQGNDSLYGGNHNDILVGGTGDDRVIGDDGHDLFWCRHASVLTRWDDPSDNVSDCGDTRGRSVESTVERDPYEEWAYMVHNAQGVTYYHFTTSNPGLLLSDRAAGASILMEWPGDIPFAGNFDGDPFNDDVGVYRSRGPRWWFDYDHNATSNHNYAGWGAPGDRPIVGDFDSDGELDDIAVFRPANRRWYYDIDHDGTTDQKRGPWGLPGDIPIAGDFDCDGYANDVGVFRPGTTTWYYDHGHDGTRDGQPIRWGAPGDIPVVGDFNRNQCLDDVAVFRPSTRRWYYDDDHDGTTDDVSRRWAVEGDLPVAGDFDGDNEFDDVGVFRTSNNNWYFDHDHDGTRDDRQGPWGFAGEPLHTSHKQYGGSCGPTALNMVMEYLGKTNPTRSLCYMRDVNFPTIPVTCVGFPWGAIDVGYEMSMEHILYEGFHRYHALDDPDWNPGSSCIGSDERFITDDDGEGAYFDIKYDIGNVDWNPSTHTTTGNIQLWIEACGGVGWKDGLTDRGLPWIANKFGDGSDDALPVSTEIGPGKSFVSLNHLKAIIRAFIDHGLPMVAAVESGGHFNTLMGYWDTRAVFYVYLADTLDGAGRPFYAKPMRWRRVILGNNALNGRSGTIPGLMVYGHGAACSGSNAWAANIDAAYGSDTLCGHL